MNEVEYKPTRVQLALRALLTGIVVAAGFAILGYMVATRPVPKKVPREDLGTLVDVIEVSPSTQKVTVAVSGQVIPAQQVALTPEVGGRVVWVSDQLLPGGRIARGDTVIRIDSRDYNLAVQQQLAQVESATTSLQIERSQKQIAEREWKLMKQDAPADTLVLREPQLRSAQAALQAAKSGLDRSKLSVSRTLVKAPFNGMIMTKNVDLGQLVSQQTPVATLVGTDAFWVQVSIPMDRLSWIQIPGVAGATEGSSATVVQEVGTDRVTRPGKVLRLLTDLDPVGRMARVLVEIPDPLGTSSAKSGAPALPLLLGAYVNVEIEGKEAADVTELPREALRGGNQVYVMTADQTLDIREVFVLWRRPDTVFVSAGLRPGDKVVLSPLSMPLKGMKLRAAPGAGPSKAAAPATPTP